MKKSIFLFIFYFSKVIFSAEITTLPVSVMGKVISLEENVVTSLEKNLKEIKLTNNFSSDLFIFGKADTIPFLYKIRKNETKLYRIEAKVINSLFYILNGNIYMLKTYSDIKKISS